MSFESILVTIESVFSIECGVDSCHNRVGFFNRVDSCHNRVGFFNRAGLSQSSRFLSQSSRFLSQSSRFFQSSRFITIESILVTIESVFSIESIFVNRVGLSQSSRFLSIESVYHNRLDSEHNRVDSEHNRVDSGAVHNTFFGSTILKQTACCKMHPMMYSMKKIWCNV